MGFVTQYFIKPYKRPLVQPPAGSFLIDAAGQIFSSTLPSSFPIEDIKFIGQTILTAFKQAAAAEIPLRELFVQFEQVKLKARHLPSGALVSLVSADPAATPEN